MKRYNAGDVHIWDMGILCRFFYTPGGASYAASRLIKVIRKHAKAEGASHVVLCADTPRTPTWRHKLYPLYKAHRPERDENVQVALELQQQEAVELAERFSMLTLRAPGWEADDIVATVERRVADASVGAVVFSTDKDMAQLIGPTTRLHDGKEFVTQEAVLKRFGVEFWQVGDFLSLAGDASDGIPGVQGIGPKAAGDILRKYGTLEAAIRGTQEGDVNSAAMRKLASAIKEARLSRQLVSLDTNAPVALPWEA